MLALPKGGELDALILRKEGEATPLWSRRGLSSLRSFCGTGASSLCSSYDGEGGLMGFDFRQTCSMSVAACPYD